MKSSPTTTTPPLKLHSLNNSKYAECHHCNSSIPPTQWCITLLAWIEQHFLHTITHLLGINSLSYPTMHAIPSAWLKVWFLPTLRATIMVKLANLWRWLHSPSTHMHVWVFQTLQAGLGLSGLESQLVCCSGAKSSCFPVFRLITALYCLLSGCLRLQIKVSFSQCQRQNF